MKKTIVFLLFSFITSLSFSQTSWELKKDEEGIQVYTREINGSSINEFRAVAVYQTTMNELVRVITDAQNLKRWNYKTIKSKLLKKTSNNKFIVYMYNDFGWLVKDRDHVSEITVGPVNETTIKITINSLPKYLPEVANAIRIKEFSGFWLLEKQTNGIRVTQQMHGEPRGYVPTMLVNATLAKAPLYTFKQLKKVLKTSSKH